MNRTAPQQIEQPVEQQIEELPEQQGAEQQQQAAPDESVKGGIIIVGGAPVYSQYSYNYSYAAYQMMYLR
jgi:hypothetical protein